MNDVDFLQDIIIFNNNNIQLTYNTILIITSCVYFVSTIIKIVHEATKPHMVYTGSCRKRYKE